MSDCIFCRIVSGDIPARIVARSPHAVAFHDLNPQAPVHVLIIPTTHLASAVHAGDEEGEVIMGRMMRQAVVAAATLGLEQGYRLVVNTGMEGGQTVGHLHVHLLGGRQMNWPPG